MRIIISKADRLWKMPQPLLGGMKFARKRLSSRGVDLIDLDGFAPEPPDLPALKAAPPGLPERIDATAELVLALKEKIIDSYPYLKAAALDPEKEIIVTPGIRAATTLIALGILNQGNTALYPDPGLQYTRLAASLADSHAKRYNLLESNDYVANIASLVPTSHKRLKILFVNYPHNPSGATVEIYFYRELFKALRFANILTVADCAYVYPGDATVCTPLQVIHASRMAVELHSFATTLGIPELGFAVGHKNVISILRLLLDSLGFVPENHRLNAATQALGHAKGIFDWRMDTLHNRREIINGLKELGWHIRSGKLLPFVWAKPPVRSTSVAFARRLFIKAGVKVTPGSDLGEYGEGWLRMALIPDEGNLREAVNRLSEHSRIWQRKFRPEAD
jgi:aspartate/methionine/tyrosine aminotransferase